MCPQAGGPRDKVLKPRGSRTPFAGPADTVTRVPHRPARRSPGGIPPRTHWPPPLQAEVPRQGEEDSPSGSPTRAAQVWPADVMWDAGAPSSPGREGARGAGRGHEVTRGSTSTRLQRASGPRTWDRTCRPGTRLRLRRHRRQDCRARQPVHSAASHVSPRAHVTSSRARRRHRPPPAWSGPAPPTASQVQPRPAHTGFGHAHTSLHHAPKALIC
jgi:hypothetical protein